MLSSFVPVTSSWEAKVNPTSMAAARSPISIPCLQGVTYTGITPMLNAMRTDSLDIGTVDFSQLTDVSSLKSQHVFGQPDFRWAGVIWNFEDKTGHFDKIVSQLYFRQAMAMLEDEPAIVARIYHGAAGLAYGPIRRHDSLHAEQSGQDRRTPTTRRRPSHSSRPTAGTWSPTARRTALNAGSGSNECGAGDWKGNAAAVVHVVRDGQLGNSSR